MSEMTENTEKTVNVNVIEWRGKVTAILEYLAKQIEELKEDLKRVVSKETFDALNLRLCSLERQFAELTLQFKVIDTKEVVEKDSKNKHWDIAKIIIAAIIGSVITIVAKRITGF